jgi:tetratricopeptide (TPR) repeat protein
MTASLAGPGGRGAVARVRRLGHAGHGCLVKILLHRVLVVGVAAAAAVGGVAGAVVFWWPTGGLPDGWLDRGDQMASITSMLLTAAGLALTYLALRGRRASAPGQGRQSRSLVPQGGSATLVADVAASPSVDRVRLERLPQPRQLPADPPSFTGRAVEIERLLRLMPDPEHTPAAIIISAIDGMAGIGKTALAVHAGHRIAERYPDGQLFIDLHGFTQAMAPVEAGDALDRMLRGLGVPGDRIPADLDDRAGLWRSTLAGRRMLIVLDNAATEAQVTPLLPGTPGCLVMVTSRRSLVGLAATDNLSLDTLPLADAIMLFTRAAGEQRLAGESPALVAEIVELCGCLPLAIWIAAARLRPHPAWRLGNLVERLRGQQQRLPELEAGQRGVTAALEVSYRQLSTKQRRLYRRLGLHPGPDMDTYAAAALAGTSPWRAGRLLDELLVAHLLQEPVPGRYVFHDLVRAHAASAVRVEAEREQRAALTRLLDHYRHTASVAMDLAHPYERDRRPRVPPAGTPTPELPDSTQANAWLDTELPNLLAVAQHAAEYDWHEHIWHLSAILHRHLRTRASYSDAEALHHRALATARASGHHGGELDALLGLGQIHRKQGRYEQAIAHLRQALEVARTTANRAGELDALTGLGQAHQRQGRYGQAIAHLRQALEVARTTGNRAGELDALDGLGWVHLLQDRYEQATATYRQVLDIATEIGNRTGELDALTGLGWVHLARGLPEQATDHYLQALEIARTTGNRTGELDALLGLGRTHRLQGRYEQAINHYGQVLEIAQTINNHACELDALIGLGHIHRLQGRHEQASETYRQILTMAREIGNRNGQFEALQGLGRLYHTTSHPDLAHAHHRQALQLAIDLQQPADQARAHDGLAHTHHALNQHKQARQHWQHALNILTSIGADHTNDEEASVPTIRVRLAALGRRDH